MESYFEDINSRVKQAYVIANQAKSKGLDPETEVTIPLARNMAERVIGIISSIAPQIANSGIIESISEIERQYGKLDWRVAFKIAEEVSQEKFCKFKDKKEAIEVALRLGLAYLTVGVVASPLEGFTRLEFKKRFDGRDYFALYFSGPIRSAGTTAVCVFIALADYIKKISGFADYDPTEQEVKRIITEINDFHERVTNLQYLPSQEELKFMAEHMPVQITGDPSEKYEVSNYKDLPRIETNNLRNGVCLVFAEALCQKAAKFFGKFSRWYKDFNMENWAFLSDFVSIQKSIRAKRVIQHSDEKILPDYTFIKDIVAGRPVITHPLKQGGLRLRYGRTRTSGFSCTSVHPATMIILREMIAIGTQLKIERPAKSSVLSTCDSIDAPIVKLKNGSVRCIKTPEEAKSLLKEIEEIVYLGDILISYGDFFDRAHKLVPVGFNEEWWLQYLKKARDSLPEEGGNLSHNKPVSIETAIAISRKYGIPLHPTFIFFWNAVSLAEFANLYNCLKDSPRVDGRFIINNLTCKRTLELIGIEHAVASNEYIVIEKDAACALELNLGNLKCKSDEINEKIQTAGSVLRLINSISEFDIKDKLGTFIGARMGRPEKSKIRKMQGSPHALFPVGKEGGKMRSFQSALAASKVTAEFPIFFCELCNKKTIYSVCELCNKKTTKLYFCRQCNEDKPDCIMHGKGQPYKLQTIDIKHYYNSALARLGIRNSQELVKGVRGLSSAGHIPENLAKAILRAKYKIYVNKDGTVRYDMTEMPITHFKQREIGTPIEKLLTMGYTKDINGNEIMSGDQVIEIKPQDIILPCCKESPDLGADEILFRVANFIDDSLEKLYCLPRFYSLKAKEDLVNHLVVAMSPHTSAGIIARIIGFSKTQGFLAHPLLHSIMRRDCDGDEAGILLLMDCLINFSRKYLPNTRGITQDAPIVLTSTLMASEVDDMVFNMDICPSYPLELYESAEQYKMPFEVAIPQLRNYLGTERQYEGLNFTHQTADINEGARCSSYKTLPSMKEKVVEQMELAKQIRAVDESDVARLVIERHFLRDIKGNLRKFSMQTFRCVMCNEIFRRPPLAGKCTKCNGRIVFTISEGSIIKYLAPALELIERYQVSPYLKQAMLLLSERIESVFGKEPEIQEGLKKWF
ncbi:DNA polymerase II large subunit [archaeon]|nr:DNA polymerase II large subunit [archaeon]